MVSCMFLRTREPDDAALASKDTMQRIISCFAEATHLFGLVVSLKKTEVLHQPAPREEYQPPHSYIEKTELKSVHQFTYLGWTVSSDAKLDGD